MCDNVLFDLKKIAKVGLASISLEDGEQGSCTRLGSTLSGNLLLELFQRLLQLCDVSLHPSVVRLQFFPPRLIVDILCPLLCSTVSHPLPSLFSLAVCW